MKDQELKRWRARVERGAMEQRRIIDEVWQSGYARVRDGENQLEVAESMRVKIGYRRGWEKLAAKRLEASVKGGASDKKVRIPITREMIEDKKPSLDSAIILARRARRYCWWRG